VADAEKGVFDLVISDIGLPDGTGYQLMRVLKAKYNLKVKHISLYYNYQSWLSGLQR
jgi:CheY-like chemotaxis protein